MLPHLGYLTGVIQEDIEQVNNWSDPSPLVSRMERATLKFLSVPQQNKITAFGYLNIFSIYDVTGKNHSEKTNRSLGKYFILTNK